MQIVFRGLEEWYEKYFPWSDDNLTGRTHAFTCQNIKIKFINSASDIFDNYFKFTTSRDMHFDYQHFLGHRSQRLQWPIVITRCPASVRRPSVRRPLDYLHFRLLLQNRLMDFDETWYGWSTQGPLQVLLFFGQIRPGADPGRGKNRSGGPLLQETSSSDQKATATNRMHSSDLETCEKKCCYFWFHFEVKFLTRFWRLFGLS